MPNTLPDKKLIATDLNSNRCLSKDNCIGCDISSVTSCKIMIALEKYESQIAPIIKAKDEEIAALKDALLIFATIGEAIANHRKNKLEIKDSYLVKAYTVYDKYYKESKR